MKKSMILLSAPLAVLCLTIPVVHQRTRATILDTSPSEHANGWAPRIRLASLSPNGTPTEEAKFEVFNKVWKLFKTYYPNFDMKGINWSAERGRYQPEALVADTWPAFFGVVNEMISDLDDPHCALIGAPLPTNYSPLVLTAWVNGQIVVVGSTSSVQIPVGSIITGVNGRPIARRLNRSEYSKGSVEAGGFHALWGDTDSPETLSLWIPATNQTRTVTLDVYPVSGSVPNDDPVLANIASSAWAYRPGATYGTPLTPGAYAFRITYLSNNVLYVYVPAMESPMFNPDSDPIQADAELQSEFQEVLALAQHANGLVMDIRGNDGGDMWPGLWFARHLYRGAMTPSEVRFPLRVSKNLPSQLNGFAGQSIMVRPVSKAADSGFTPWGTLQIASLSPQLKIPVVLLTDQWDASAAENFTLFMQSAPNVATFGSTTSGEDSSPQFYPLMKGVRVAISRWQERVSSTGLPIEGFGLPPDVAVPVSDMQEISEIVRSQQSSPQETMLNDPVLQAAVRWIHNQDDK